MERASGKFEDPITLDDDASEDRFDNLSDDFFVSPSLSYQEPGTEGENSHDEDPIADVRSQNAVDVTSVPLQVSAVDVAFVPAPFHGAIFQVHGDWIRTKPPVPAWRID